MRVAALDLGTNTTRLLVADVADGRVADEIYTGEMAAAARLWITPFLPQPGQCGPACNLVRHWLARTAVHCRDEEGPHLRAFLCIAGAGFEPATSGL